MDTGLPDADSARRQLERVLSSPGFVRNERMCRFLRFLTERHLEGNGHQLKESVIAVEVFGRRTDHDPSQDSVVRTEASRLRARLAEYYLGAGAADAVVIELPKGGYTPTFRNREPDRQGLPTGEKRRRPWWPFAVATGVVAALLLLWSLGRHQTTPVQVAVLPLENLDHNPASDYFADGLTDELIRNLSLIEGLATRSRTSSFAFKGRPRNVRAAGKELGTDFVVEGSVLRIGHRLRVDAQLVRVRDDFPLWSGRYDRSVTDVFAIQDEISRSIVNSLRLKLGRGRRRYETSTEAYDLYLRARALNIQQGLSGEVQSVASFEEAIAKDPSFAPAHAGLATALVTRSGTTIDSADDLARMEKSAEKALELDPLLAEAHGALGMVYARKAQWQQSEKSFRRALELDPNDSVLYDNFALSLLFPLGRIQDAVRQLRIALSNDPLAPRVRFILANALMAAGRFDEAAAYSLSLPSDFPGRNQWLGRARLGQGRIQEAIHILEQPAKERSDFGDPTLGYLGYAYGRAGRREDAENLAAKTSEPYNQAMIFAGLGDKDRTLRALERMATLGPVRLGRDLYYPEFNLVRGDPRVKALREKVGLPQ